MADQLAAVTDLLQPIASSSDRAHLACLAVLHGIVTAMLLAAFFYQRINSKKYSSFWLIRLTNYTGYTALTINTFSIWLPMCALYSGLEMGANIWQLQHWVLGGDQTNFVVVYVLPRLILLYLGWVAAASIIFSGLAVFALSRQAGGDRLRVQMPNTYFYHGVAFVFPTLVFIAFLALTFTANDSFNKGIAPGQQLFASLAAGRIDVKAALLLKEHMENSGRLVDAIRYISLAMIATMIIFFQPAAVALVLAIRRNASVRCNTANSTGSSQSLRNTQKILIIYGVYTTLWIALTAYQILALIIYTANGDPSEQARFISLRLSGYINGIGALTSAIILGGRSFVQTPIEQQGNSRLASSSHKSHKKNRSSSPNVPLQLLVTTDTHVASEDKDMHLSGQAHPAILDYDSTYQYEEKQRHSSDSHTIPFA